MATRVRSERDPGLKIEVDKFIQSHIASELADNQYSATRSRASFNLIDGGDVGIPDSGPKKFTKSEQATLTYL
jgi:hypothetical protein